MTITENIKKHKALTSEALIVILMLIDWLIFKDPLKVSNHFFMAGLLLLIVGIFFVLERGHLFTGWFRRPAKGEDDSDRKKIDVHKVGREKNGPIVITKPARYFLNIGSFTIIVSVLISLF
ncbi:hypothetical protein AH70_07855 [Pediococcus damnosus LMG 28219]|uniref:DUF3899 domain-containing protein n=2 Tax=Pediococcus damnosus TaxID=51663 RepID=UPI00061EAA6B|nr:DUF3899 domain-containing protein [Pediococcus damnosus]KJU74226.1 hypothetical protein AH70_07855 [Pediococcus damnosus LMG 28219]KRN53587.1 hypothetical protein IV84_GL000103 [Pediococcus damnosus]PIO81419.1 hypothetical protein BSQ38_07020 [Pediococcus damnosus]PIO85047.1 hypothetical protein BSQ37_03500 [Pediococcus damnosus]PJE49056.1 DUF3899 domain-containing protein [Pediococcus damnosus]